MNKILKHSKLFFKKNSSTILSSLAIVGLVATTITSAKATPKAIKLVEEFKESNGTDEVSKVDIFKITYKQYLPTVIIGAATVSCIIFSNKINIERQKDIMTAYILLHQTFEQYKNKVKELYGEDADNKIKYEIYKENKTDNPCLIMSSGDDKIIFYMDYYDRFFERSMLEVREAEYQLNRQLIKKGEVPLNYFLELLDLPTSEEGKILGWSQDSAFDIYNYTWVDFSHEQMKTEDDLECIYIKMLAPPMPGYDLPF